MKRTILSFIVVLSCWGLVVFGVYAQEDASEDIEVLHEMDVEMQELFEQNGWIPPSMPEELLDESESDVGFGYVPLPERAMLKSPDLMEKPWMRIPARSKQRSRSFQSVPGIRFPVVMNEQVRSWIEFFTTRARRYFRRYLERAGRYIPLMKEIFRQEGLPEDLAYLSMIESGFSLHAKSWAGAVGPWQFMPSTARHSGLRVDRTIDERRDFILSTKAAARHLKYLFKRFGDWYLAIAAYNAGARRIERAIQRYSTTNYWELSQYDYLALETKLYVPKFLAALVIVHNPGKYGFTGVESQQPVTFDTVQISGPASLFAISKVCGCSEQEIRDLNASFIRGIVPADGKKYEIRLPKGRAEQFVSAWASVPLADRVARSASELAQNKRLKRKLRKRSYSGKNSKGIPGRFVAEVYTVRFGDSLFAIAKRFGMSMDRLLELNDIKNKNRLHPGEKLLVERFVPDIHYELNAEGKPVLKKARPKKGKPDPFSGQRLGRKVHILKRGETLWHLSIKYNVPIKRLMRLNHIRNASRLRPGQRIIIRR